MAGLLSGLGRFGLDNLEGMSLHDEKEVSLQEEKREKPEVKELTEADYLFDKKYHCPVCDRDFVEKTVKAGKVRQIGSDSDLRPIFKEVDLTKYDVVMCPHCGYTALTRYFDKIYGPQIKAVGEQIARKFVPTTKNPGAYTYEEAYEHYQLALGNAIVKQAKESEKAYICLKTSWLLRGMLSEMKESADLQADKMAEFEQIEAEYAENALDCFVKARESEYFPICGMDELTLNCIMAALSIRFKRVNDAAKLIQAVLTSPAANNRQKDKARELKDALRVLISKQGS